jgi:hypothetical protein
MVDLDTGLGFIVIGGFAWVIGYFLTRMNVWGGFGAGVSFMGQLCVGFGLLLIALVFISRLLQLPA